MHGIVGSIPLEYDELAAAFVDGHEISDERLASLRHAVSVGTYMSLCNQRMQNHERQIAKERAAERAAKVKQCLDVRGVLGNSDQKLDAIITLLAMDK